jgi:hypothetical protein
VLAIEITRDGFEWALAHACLSHYEPGSYRDHDAWTATKEASPVRIQWDPERDITLAPLEHRAIQIGLSREAAEHYIDDWTVTITDITDVMQRIHTHVEAGEHEAARALLPGETPYSLTTQLAAHIGATA